MARCRVCHHELTNAAHAVEGVGPICKARAARYGVGTGQDTGSAERHEQAQARLQRIERVERMLARLWAWTSDQEFNVRLAADRGTPEQVAHFTERVAFGWRWYARWQRIEQDVKRAVDAASVRHVAA